MTTKLVGYYLTRPKSNPRAIRPRSRSLRKAPDIKEVRLLDGEGQGDIIPYHNDSIYMNYPQAIGKKMMANRFNRPFQEARMQCHMAMRSRSGAGGTLM